ncbi:MAG: NUDIX domain-containing protein [Chloroflexi bacterium]|nr:NUDIX domain-containing protein [Chloroflexota bacterium]
MAEIYRYQAAGGVVIHAGKMLLLNRPKRHEIRLPKGHIDPGETPEVTALREAAEESGYDDLAIIADLGSQIVEFDLDNRHVIRTEFYFLMRLLSDRQISRPAHDTEQFKVRWTPVDEAIDLLTYAPEKSVAAKALTAAKAFPSL